MLALRASSRGEPNNRNELRDHQVVPLRLSTSGAHMRRLTMKGLATKCWRLRSLALATILVATSAAWYTNRRPALSELIRTGKLVAQVNSVPSHNRRYRATLRPELTAAGHIADWQMLIETSNGNIPASPTLAVRSWMPEAPSVSGDR